MSMLPVRIENGIVKVEGVQGIKGIKVVPIILLVLLSLVGCSALFRVVAPVEIEKTIVVTKVDTVADETLIAKLKSELSNEKKKRKSLEKEVVKEKYSVDKELDGLKKSLGSNKKSTGSVPITDLITDKNVLDFITHNEVLARATRISKLTGLNVSVIIAQKGLESNWGKSRFTQITKCLGNIKCFNKSCKKYNKKGLKHKQIGHIGEHCVQLYDDNEHDRFIRFPTFHAGWNHYLALIEKRYMKAGTKNTSKEQIQTIKNLGYATDRKYAVKVNAIIKNYGLDKLDKAIDSDKTITTQTGQYILLK